MSPLLSTALLPDFDIRKESLAVKFANHAVRFWHTRTNPLVEPALRAEEKFPSVSVGSPAIAWCASLARGWPRDALVAGLATLLLGSEERTEY